MPAGGSWSARWSTWAWWGCSFFWKGYNMAKKGITAQSTGKSFVRTGGTWVPGCTPTGAYGCRTKHDGPCWAGRYEGGTQRSGRFTSTMAPLPVNPFRQTPIMERVTPAPDYRTPECVTLRAFERGTVYENPSVRMVYMLLRQDGLTYRQFQRACKNLIIA